MDYLIKFNPSLSCQRDFLNIKSTIWKVKNQSCEYCFIFLSIWRTSTGNEGIKVAKENTREMYLLMKYDSIKDRV